MTAPLLSTLHCCAPAGDSLMTLLQRTMSAEVSLMVQEDHRLTGHTGPVLSLAYDELQHRLYTAGLDCTIKVGTLAAMQPATAAC